MVSCDCPCEAGQHAPVAEFGSSMCLTPGCDCEGTREQVAAMLAERMSRNPNSKLERLVALIREVTSNPMPRSIDDQARNIAAALVATYEIEERT